MKLKLINRNFSLLVLGQSLSLIGDIINSIALLWAVYDIFGSSGRQTGLLFGLSTIPTILMYPFAGNFADFFNRKTLLFICDLVAGILALILYGLFTAHLANFYYLLALLSANSIIFSLLATTKTAIIQNIVTGDELTKANSFDNLASNVLHIVIPTVGTLLIARINVAYCFLINGLSFFIAAVFTLRMQVPTIPPGERKYFFAEFKEGIKYLGQHLHFLYFILIFSVVNFLFASDNLLIRILMSKQHIDVDFFGYYKTILAIGSIVLAFLLSKSDRLPKISLLASAKRSMTAGFLLLGFAFFGYTLGMKLSILGGALLQGMGLTWINITFISYMQRSIEKTFYGRTISVLFFISEIAAPLGYSLFGTLSDKVPIQIILAAIGGCTLLIALIFTCFIQLKEENLNPVMKTDVPT